MSDKVKGVVQVKVLETCLSLLDVSGKTNHRMSLPRISHCVSQRLFFYCGRNQADHGKNKRQWNQSSVDHTQEKRMEIKTTKLPTRQKYIVKPDRRLQKAIDIKNHTPGDR